jgi:hypothetical protein
MLLSLLHQQLMTVLHMVLSRLFSTHHAAIKQAPVEEK